MAVGAAGKWRRIVGFASCAAAVAGGALVGAATTGGLPLPNALLDETAPWPGLASAARADAPQARTTGSAAPGARRAATTTPEGAVATARAHATPSPTDVPMGAETPGAVMQRRAAWHATLFPPEPTHEAPSPTAPTRSGLEGMPLDVTGARFRDGLLITGSTPHRLILFTFDDGPDRRNTPRLLDHLDRAGVKAVFFVTAHRVRGENAMQREQAEILRDLARRGHLVGNHTVDHLALPTLSNDDASAQITGNEAILERILGARPWLFRPPYGQRTPRIDELLRQRGYTIVLWNLGAGDWQCSSAEEVFHTWKRVFDRRETEVGDRGGIVLLHDTHPWSVDAFPLIHAELMRRNCALLERGEELYDILDDPAFFFAPRGAARASTHGPRAVLSPEVLEARQAPLRARTRERCEAERAAASRGH